MNQLEFAGKTALVTGGSKGIGRVCCEQLAAAGAAVIVNYSSSEKAAFEVVEQIESSDGRAIAIRADISSINEVQEMVHAGEEALGPIDLLVNNAAIFDYVPHDETTPDIWQRTLDVNLTGTYNVTWAVKPGMIERGCGSIVNISSISALRPRPLSIAYAVSKAGMISLTQSLSVALAKTGIRVNAIAPGLIETDIISDVSQSVLDNIINQTPMERIGQPKEIADLVLFLLSERSSFMTGQTLVASGGRVMLP